MVPEEIDSDCLEDLRRRKIAYFSMEIGLMSGMPTYSGGLGILAGDTVRACADLNLSMVAISLLYRKGYFKQKLDGNGRQVEEDEKWDPEEFLKPLPFRTSVVIEGRKVELGAWCIDVESGRGMVPVLFLDADLPENSAWDRALNDHLYGGDEKYRIGQEMILGIGGGRMLGEIGLRPRKYHMNEGHASLLTLELLNRFGRDRENVRKRCVFTTHTPVSAGHDKYGYDLVRKMLGEQFPERTLKEFGGEDRLNLTLLALNLSGYVNGVARKHGEVSRSMFPGYEIDSITNGVHVNTWTSGSMKEVLAEYIPGLAKEPFSLRSAMAIPFSRLREAHLKAKRELLSYVRGETGRELKEDVFTIGYARRATMYKRAELLFTDMERLRRINKEYPIQLIYAGKAHPKDTPGKEMIENIFRAGKALEGDIDLVYLENYDMASAWLMVSGVDLWLNTPQRPLEASGTSGMKAAVNGVPSLSILDGWWIEGCIEGITGWAIGSAEKDLSHEEEAASLYDKLDMDILPLYYDDHDRWTSVMRHTIAINGSYFNTHRMIREYVLNAYLD